MDKQRIFSNLERQDKGTLLALLGQAYDQMGYDARHDVFAQHEKRGALLRVDGEALLSRVRFFRDNSLSGSYYEPFDSDSTDLPDETEAWFEEIDDFLKSTTRLSAQGGHMAAVACFEMLYQVIEKMEDGEEIVFGDDIGPWMIPSDNKLATRAYLTSLAATSTPPAFAEAVAPLAQRDSHRSFALKVYDMACELADWEQKEALVAEVARRMIRTKPRW